MSKPKYEVPPPSLHGIYSWRCLLCPQSAGGFRKKKNAVWQAKFHLLKEHGVD